MAIRNTNSRVFPLQEFLLHPLDLQRERTRVESTQRQIPTHVPETLLPAPPPQSPRLAFGIKAPYLARLLGHVLAKNLLSRFLHVAVTRREDDLVRWKLFAVRAGYGVRVDSVNRCCFHFDSAGGNEGGAAGVDVVSSASREILGP